MSASKTALQKNTPHSRVRQLLIFIVFITITSWVVTACNPPVPADAEVNYLPTDQLQIPGPEQMYARLLLRHVNRRGVINYQGLIRDSTALNTYLAYLSGTSPADSAWSERKELSFWINAYNAFTLRLVIRNYPMLSPLDIGIVTPELGTPDYESIASAGGTAFDFLFIEIGGNLYSINGIRDRVIRTQFKDPRVHFALCNATKSAPRLRREPYFAPVLNEQLEEATREFLTLPEKNQINPNQPLLHPVFEAFAIDFGSSQQELFDFINRYVPVKINPGAIPKYSKYNWLLNS